MSLEELNLSKNLAGMPLESSESSEGEVCDDVSYKSNILPPDITQGFVRVYKEYYRAKYRPSKTDYRSLAGGGNMYYFGGGNGRKPEYTKAYMAEVLS